MSIQVLSVTRVISDFQTELKEKVQFNQTRKAPFISEEVIW